MDSFSKPQIWLRIYIKFKCSDKIGVVLFFFKKKKVATITSQRPSHDHDESNQEENQKPVPVHPPGHEFKPRRHQDRVFSASQTNPEPQACTLELPDTARTRAKNRSFVAYVARGLFKAGRQAVAAAPRARAGQTNRTGQTKLARVATPPRPPQPSVGLNAAKQDTDELLAKLPEPPTHPLPLCLERLRRAGAAPPTA